MLLYELVMVTNCVHVYEENLINCYAISWYFPIYSVLDVGLLYVYEYMINLCFDWKVLCLIINIVLCGLEVLLS